MWQEQAGAGEGAGAGAGAKARARAGAEQRQYGYKVGAPHQSCGSLKANGWRKARSELSQRSLVGGATTGTRTSFTS